MHRTSQWTSLAAQAVKRLPTMQEIRVHFLGQEDPLEEEMATHSSILAWKIPWTEESGGLQTMVSQSRTRLSDFTCTFQSVKEAISSSKPTNEPSFHHINTDTYRQREIYIYTHIYSWREIGRESVTLRIGSRDYGSHRVPWTAIHKLENKESQCFSSVQVWRPQNQRSQWRKSHQQSKNPRRWRGAGRHNFVSPGPSCKAQEPGALLSGALSSGREQTHPSPSFLL